MPSVTMAMMIAHLYESYLCMIVLGRSWLKVGKLCLAAAMAPAFVLGCRWLQAIVDFLVTVMMSLQGYRLCAWLPPA